MYPHFGGYIAGVHILCSCAPIIKAFFDDIPTSRECSCKILSPQQPRRNCDRHPPVPGHIYTCPSQQGFPKPPPVAWAAQTGCHGGICPPWLRISSSSWRKHSYRTTELGLVANLANKKGDIQCESSKSDISDTDINIHELQRKHSIIFCIIASSSVCVGPV